MVYKFSILIPTLHTRMENFQKLINKIIKKINENNLQNEIQIISHFDNKTIGLSKKRTEMLSNAIGDFITFIDDDDDISDDYIKLIYHTIINNPDSDVITFMQHCNVDGRKFNLICDINYNTSLNKTNNPNLFIRYPWIWCVWKRDKVKNNLFYDENPNRKNYGEDAVWCKNNIKNIKKETKINKILHYYQYSSLTTETQK